MTVTSPGAPTQPPGAPASSAPRAKVPWIIGLPRDLDPTTITTVAVWCKRFDATCTEAALA